MQTLTRQIGQATVQLTDIEVRSSGKGPDVVNVQGYAAVFDQPSLNLGWFTEKIDRNAFDSVLASNPDIFLVHEHDMSKPLARTSHKSLQMSVDERGLKIWAQVTLDATYKQDVIAQLRSGLIDQMSFAFAIESAEWFTDADGNEVRTVLDIAQLYDVSIVALGAYPQTGINIERSYQQALEQRNAAKDGHATPEAAEDDSAEHVTEKRAETEAVAVETPGDLPIPDAPDAVEELDTSSEERRRRFALARARFTVADIHQSNKDK